MQKLVTMQEFEYIIEKMKKCITLYENLGLDGNDYNMCLANGDYLNLRMLPNNIPHLLGFNVGEFRTMGYVNPNRSAYDILKYFLENSTYYSLKNKFSAESISNLFSDYINEKLDSFVFNIQLKPESIYYIIKYDSERTYMVEELSEKSDYYIVRKNDNNYYVLGIVKKEGSNSDYLPMTSRVYKDEECFNEFMARICKNQEITYAYKATVKNFDNGFNGNYRIVIDKKKEMLERISKSANKFSAIASTNKDFILSLNSASNGFQKNDNNMVVLKLLTDSIKTGNVLTMDEIKDVISDAKINDDVIELIDAYNDMVSSKEFGSIEARGSFSTVQSENIKLKDENDKALDEIKSLKSELESHKQELVSIKIENEAYKSKFEILDEAFQKVKTM